MQKTDSKKIENLVNETKIPIRIACITSSGHTIVVSIWYTMIGEKIYSATQKKAKIINIIKNNPN